MLSLIIGVSAVILLVACGYGVKNLVNARVETMANQIGIVPKAADVPGGPPARNLTDADASALQDAPDVAAVTPSINSSGIMIATGTVKLISATTIGTTENWPATNNRVLTAGSFFDQTQGRQTARVTVVGPTVANTLFGDPTAALNQTVQINHVPFRVIGVLASYGQQEDNTAVVPLGTARRYIVGTGNTLNGITAQATQQAAVPTAMAQLTRILDDRHHITDPQLRDFQIQTLGHRLQTFNQIMRLLVLFIPAIAVILLIVGGIGVLNIMLASVTERTREVSSREASDATNRANHRQVLIESVVIAGLGGALAGFIPVLSIQPLVVAFAISLLIASSPAATPPTVPPDHSPSNPLDTNNTPRSPAAAPSVVLRWCQRRPCVTKLSTPHTCGPHQTRPLPYRPINGLMLFDVFTAGNTDVMAGAIPEERVTWPVAHQRWQAFTFLHWAYDPAEVQRLLPSELQVHTHDGLAWVGLTPFLLSDFHPPGLPAIPGLSTFPETNLRTYVLNSNGLDGLWFFSLDADELATVLGARALLQGN